MNRHQLTWPGDESATRPTYRQRHPPVRCPLRCQAPRQAAPLDGRGPI